MARMLPERIPDWVIADPKRAAERKVYEALREQLPEQFTVFYLAAWRGHDEDGRIIEGEADFVVAHPQWGFICLEVKGGEVSRDGQTAEWSSRDEAGRVWTIKDPVEQARASKHQLLRKVKNFRGWSGAWLNAKHGVILPRSGMAAHDLGADMPLSIFAFAEDMGSLSERVTAMLLEDVGSAATYDHLGLEGISVLERLLAPSFDLRLPLSTVVGRNESEVVRLTREQFQVLDGLAANRRVAISGGAGTGKTVLATEKALRLAEEGRETLLLCFNTLLANTLQQTMAGNARVHVHTFHQLCGLFARRAGIRVPPLNPDDPESFYSSILPEKLVEALDLDRDLRFEAVVVDEGQDFREAWWIPVQLTLADPDTSVMYIFYDDNQAIYSQPATVIRETGSMQFRLTRNLRNTLQILDCAQRFYRGQQITGSGIDGPPVRWIAAEDERQEITELRKLLDELVRQEKIPPGQIAVLSGRAIERSLLGGKNKLGNIMLAGGDDPGMDRVLVETIHRFKGLERPVVVLLGLETAVASDDLYYVGLTRARQLLCVIASRDLISELESRFPGLTAPSGSNA